MNEQVKRSCVDAAAEIAWRQAAESNAETPWPYPEDAQFSHIIRDGQQMARDDAQLWADRFAEAGFTIVPVAPDAGRVHSEWLAQVIQGAVNTEIEMDEDWSGGLSMPQARTVADAVLALLRGAG